MLFSGTTRWWLAGYLLLTLACTAAWLLLDQRLTEQSGLRRQVWLSSDFQGAPFIWDVSPGAGLEFLDDPQLPCCFFSARWFGYWYVPTDRAVMFRVNADDYVDIWLDGELRFSKSTAAARTFVLVSDDGTCGERADGFRQTERRSYDRRRSALWHDGNPALPELDEIGQRRWVNDEMAAQSIDSLLADPLRHLKISLLFFWRGAFTEDGLGFRTNPVNRRLADIHGLPDWPRWRWAYGGIAITLVNLVGLLALFVVPFWFWLGRARFDVALLFLPALYAHGAYAVTSHFLPRYAELQIPPRVAATMLLLFLAWSILRKLVRSRSSSSTLS